MKKCLVVIGSILLIIIIVVCLNIYVTTMTNNSNEQDTTDTHVNTQVNTIDSENNANEDNATGDYSTVYFTSDISPTGLMNIYNMLEFTPQGNTAIKLSTGEAGGNNYLSPDLIKDLVQSVNGTIVECNTAYGGSRSSTAAHMQVAEDHGFTQIANVDILDANGYTSLEVPNGKHLTEDLVGKNYENYGFSSIKEARHYYRRILAYIEERLR